MILNITDSAREYLTNQAESERKRFAYLSVLGGGCSGFQYKWDMVDEEKDGIVYVLMTRYRTKSEEEEEGR